MIKGSYPLSAVKNTKVFLSALVFFRADIT